MAEKRNPGALAGATGAGCLRAAAFGPQHIARPEGRRHYAGPWAYHITPDDGGPTFTLYLRGRQAWALDRLAEAGPMGCAPIDRPAPRWSGYVFDLRGKGVPIVTVRERHGGAFPGVHGRYRLAARVRRAGA